MAIAVGGTRLLRKLCTIHARKPHPRCLTRDPQDDRTPASGTLLTQPCSPMFEIRDLRPAKGSPVLWVDALSPRRVPVRRQKQPRLKPEAPKWRIPPGLQEVFSGGHRLHEAGRGKGLAVDPAVRHPSRSPGAETR